VLYIAGMGRSGSTMIDRLLGQTDQFHTSGELDLTWLSFDSRLKDWKCSCGANFWECPFWTGVRERLGDTVTTGSAALISSYHFGRVFSMWHLWRSLLSNRRFDHLAHAPDRYLGDVATLYRAIADEAASQWALDHPPVIIDSSKFPSYLTNLVSVSSLRVKVLHLIRDPRAVAFSFARPLAPNPDGTPSVLKIGPLRSSLIWVMFNFVTERTVRRLRLPVYQVRYEDLVADSKAVIDGARRFAAPSSPLGMSARPEPSARTHHQMFGNPMRSQSGPVRVTADNRWKTALSRRDRWLVTVVTYPLMRRYGYRVGIGASGE
jgi:hypothetical protein